MNNLVSSELWLPWQLYSSHRLIMGKKTIDKIFCLNGDTLYLDFFTEMFIE